MVERSEEQPGRSGADEHADKAGDIGGQGGEGSRKVEATPPIGDEGEKGQTTVPAPQEDVGVPPDEELSETDE
jgi:hypothetical protein